MRWCDIDRTPVMVGDAKLWTYTVPHGKTEHHGFETRYALGTKAQGILNDFLKTDQHARLFRAADAMADRSRALRQV
jgi:hypothetical protein